MITERNVLELQFGYTNYYDTVPRSGWLLNYHIYKTRETEIMVDLYFVDEISRNFKITLPFYLSFLANPANEETRNYFCWKYEKRIVRVEEVERVDVSEYNHLNKKPTKFLKFYVRNESSLQDILRERRKTGTTIYESYWLDNDTTTWSLHEYDIPIEVQVATHFEIRCGKWYSVCYDGEEYKINKDEKLIYPDLRIMAFDIETSKEPLKFPNAERDSVMMVSVMTESSGILIVNRELVAENVAEFEYEARDDMKRRFSILNEPGEESLLLKFVETIQEHMPHIITTYNGGQFDWPFIESRCREHGINLTETTSFLCKNEYYESPFIAHMDCYKWVKRDSYLPMNNQGLKDATRIKLGYFPDEIDPEDMMRCAQEDSQRLASYSVSDAVATYFLYMKYVHSHIFSIGSLVPRPIVDILCRGSGTLCEALLFAESQNYKLLVPPGRKEEQVEYYDGHVITAQTYVGGHVESLQAGVFRSDFEHKFCVNREIVDEIVRRLDDILYDVIDVDGYLESKKKIVESLKQIPGIEQNKGSIWHLDVGAMYPNIIITNRLQPISVVNEERCIHCDFNNEKNNCKRSMEWTSRVEYLPAAANEISMLKSQLENEYFFDIIDSMNNNIIKDKEINNISKDKVINNIRKDNNSIKKLYSNLSTQRQENILKERITNYSRKIYKKTKEVELKKRKATICQREIPFYVETVVKFRDQRNVLKQKYKEAMSDYEINGSEDNKKKMAVYNSLQVAYKCILNSFYGYAMRKGSRWFSLEMAAIVCHEGGKIISAAKEFIKKIGVPLELDTDGIWCLLPAAFPSVVSVGAKRVNLLASTINYFICQQFTNTQYQTFEDGAWSVEPKNSIRFEADGPYKTMFIPSSTEKGRLLKKRYVVFDDKNRIAELKGFELKRRGELNFIKKFQDDLFGYLNEGKTLEECYRALGECCNYWYEVLSGDNEMLDDESIFDLLSESRNLSKKASNFGERKSNILNTARRLSEFLGDEVLEDKLKCEFIVSRFPENAPIAERCIPTLIFKHPDSSTYMKKWLKNDKSNLREIIDWEYYVRRYESILQRMVIIPAYFQKIENPIPRVKMVKWIRENNQVKLGFKREIEIEDLGSKFLKKSSLQGKGIREDVEGMGDIGEDVVGMGGIREDMVGIESIGEDVVGIESIREDVLGIKI